MPAQFAPIASPFIMEMLSPEQMGGYHLLLAHEVLKHPAAYRRAYAPERLPEGATIIMDNGAYEAGKGVTTAEMNAACDVVEPTIIVLSDVIGDSEATLRRSLDDAAYWAVYRPETPVMAVIQGGSLQQATKFAWDCRDLIGPDYWALPRHFADNGISRTEMLKDASLKRAITPINWNSSFGYTSEPFVHLMGFSNNILDDLRACRNRRVMGIDSTTPIRLGLEHTWMLIEQEIIWSRRSPEYMDYKYSLPNASLPPHVEANLVATRKMISGAWS